MNIAIIGAQWGDEGKGKIIDLLAKSKKIKTVVRYQGGPNAGHTVVLKDEKYALHLIPSGILYPDKICVIGNNVIIDPLVLAEEINNLENRIGKNHARILISEKCHLIFPWHKVRDSLDCGNLGTTGRGIGPCYEDSVGRRGIRLMDARGKKGFSLQVKKALIWNRRLIQAMKGKATLNEQKIINEAWTALNLIKKNPKIKIGDVSEFLADLKDGILFEGAQATMLDINHGTYPFVTSSNSTVGGLYTGTGFRPRKLKVIGVTKAYTTRVGAGPFPTELFDKTGEKLREVGHEFGTTTGRPRRCGWLDIAIINYAKLINGLDALAMTKLDVLTGINPLKIKVGPKFAVDLIKLKQSKAVYESMAGWKEDITKVRQFSDLPTQAKAYIKRVEKLTRLPIEMIGVGPERHQVIRHE